MLTLRLQFVLLLAMSSIVGAQIKVAVLHPLLGDLVEKVGGDRVEVVDLMGKGGDPHKFEPGAKELRQAQGAKLYFVCGKGLEPYLPKLRDAAGAQKVIEVGETLPTLKAMIDKGAKVILTAHLGRPKGERVPSMKAASSS